MFRLHRIPVSNSNILVDGHTNVVRYIVFSYINNKIAGVNRGRCAFLILVIVVIKEVYAGICTVSCKRL